jgi:dTDP-4-amino-4,6-dideoxygalactose transaminase
MSAAALRVLSLGPNGADVEVERRRIMAERLTALARRSGKVGVAEIVDGSQPGYVRLPLRARRAPVAEVVHTLKRHGAAPAYPAPLASLPPFRARVVNHDTDLVGARTLADTLFTFPTHSLMDPVDVAALESWLLA